ncbi:MAG: hypothetical protein ABWY36_08015 [Leifsonia sp.]
MSQTDAALLARTAWITPIVRAALALVAALVITFSGDHSASFGLVVFGTWATVSGVVLGALALRTLAGAARWLFAANGLVTAVAGMLALGLRDAGLGFFLYLVIVWAAVTGFIELYAGIRERSRAARAGSTAPVARDWIAVGAFTAVLALVYVLLPPNVVVSVGILGAYLVIIAVYLGIAGFSLRWDRSAASAATRSEEAQ